MTSPSAESPASPAPPGGVELVLLPRAHDIGGFATMAGHPMPGSASYRRPQRPWQAGPPPLQEDSRSLENRPTGTPALAAGLLVGGQLPLARDCRGFLLGLAVIIIGDPPLPAAEGRRRLGARPPCLPLEARRRELGEGGNEASAGSGEPKAHGQAPVCSGGADRSPSHNSPVKRVTAYPSWSEGWMGLSADEDFSAIIE